MLALEAMRISGRLKCNSLPPIGMVIKCMLRITPANRNNTGPTFNTTAILALAPMRVRSAHKPSAAATSNSAQMPQVCSGPIRDYNVCALSVNKVGAIYRCVASVPV